MVTTEGLAYPCRMLEKRAERPSPDDVAVDGTVTDVAASPPGVDRTSANLTIGQVLAGRYRLIRFIAGGGMGEVYEAEDALLGERIALKLLRPELSRKPGA